MRKATRWDVRAGAAVFLAVAAGAGCGASQETQLTSAQGDAAPSSVEAPSAVGGGSHVSANGAFRVTVVPQGLVSQGVQTDSPFPGANRVEERFAVKAEFDDLKDLAAHAQDPQFNVNTVRGLDAVKVVDEAGQSFKAERLELSGGRSAIYYRDPALPEGNDWYVLTWAEDPSTIVNVSVKSLDRSASISIADGIAPQ